MAISNAVQRGGFVYVYNEKNFQIACLPSGNGPNDGLKGYTGSSVNIQRDGFIHSYNEKGFRTSCVPIR